jgi:hypothetical protein
MIDSCSKVKTDTTQEQKKKGRWREAGGRRLEREGESEDINSSSKQNTITQ